MLCKITSLLFATFFSISCCAEVLIADIPKFDLTKVTKTGLTETQEKALLVYSLKNDKYNVSLPGVFIDGDLKDKQGKPFHSGYYSFGVGYDSPFVGATDVWGLFFVSPETGDVWEEYSCKIIFFPALQNIQEEIMKKTGVTFSDEKVQRRGGVRMNNHIL